MPKEQPKPRAADALAGEGSLLDRLRRRRMEMEQDVDDEKPTNEDHRRGYTRSGMYDET